MENVSLPGIVVPLNNGLNVLIGENDSGKSAIIDAIRLTLGTQSKDWFHLEDSDFHFDGIKRAQELKIECVFEKFTNEEAAPFLEWIDIDNSSGVPEYSLRLTYVARRTPDRISRELRAGSDPDGQSIFSAALDLLRIVYLKPLRDAESELAPSGRSRLAQILKAHTVFQKEDGKKHALEEIISEANNSVEKYFTDDDEASAILNTINTHLVNFLHPSTKQESEINISGSELQSILKRLSLVYQGESAGLGSLNLLYIAAELLLQQNTSRNELKLTIIEELEAHLHPQAQLRLVKYLETETQGQLILSTHSTTLASSLKLKNLIICKDGKAFPMGSAFTKLKKNNYDFLERFLDATKSNLFFAKGVILVEGDAENILLPTIATLIGRPLHQYGVSIVNVGSTAFLHYSKIFDRSDGQNMGIPVAIITDRDVCPYEVQIENHTGTDNIPTIESIKQGISDKGESIETRLGSGCAKVFISPHWTLEYEISLTKQLQKIFLKSILMSEKIQNAKDGAPKRQKIEEAKETANELFDEWRAELSQHSRKKEIIAKRIYTDIMLKKDISKAVVAQTFAKNIKQEYAKSSEDIISRLYQPAMRYLVNAIIHVTAALEDQPDA